MLAAFVGLMTLEGRLAAARDGASVQAVRQALKGLIPGIGNSVTDSSGALLESALTVRNAVGATGLLIALTAAVKPALALMAHMLSVKVASALIEPVADPGIVRVTACYGEIGRLLLRCIIIGLHDDTLSAPQGKMNLMVCQGNRHRLDFAIERIEEGGALEVNAQCYVCLNILWRQVGNEIVIARGVLAADGLQSIFRLHGFWLCCSIHRIHIRAIYNPSTLGFHGLDM